MNRRTTLTLTAMALLGLAVATAVPQIGFAQSDPWVGNWQLNLAKSKYSPGPPPKSNSVNIQGEGQNYKVTNVGINAEGNPTSRVATWIYDGMPHPVTGAPDYDAIAVTRADAYTVNVSRTKAGKVVQTGTNVVSRDGKTVTATITGTDANGRQINNIGVYDKQ
jgi:hypothetical protein